MGGLRVGKIIKWIVGLSFYTGAWGLMGAAGIKIDIFTKEFWFAGAAFTCVSIGFDIMTSAQKNKWPWQNG